MCASIRGQRRFTDDILTSIDDGQVLRIRAGTETHRFIGIWAVVVNRRVFVRSWSVSEGGWYRTFLEHPRGAIQVGGREITVRAFHTRSASVKDAVDRAYLEKYRAAGSRKYARDLVRPNSRDTTMELVPV